MHQVCSRALEATVIFNVDPIEGISNTHFATINNISLAKHKQTSSLELCSLSCFKNNKCIYMTRVMTLWRKGF